MFKQQKQYCSRIWNVSRCRLWFVSTKEVTLSSKPSSYVYMFEGNTMSLKENNVTPLSQKTAILYLANSNISLKSHCPFLWKWIWRNCFTHQKENCLSCPFCFKVTPIFGKEYDTPFKEAQLPSIWKGTPANGRKCFTHKIAHPPKASSLKWKTAHPQRILRVFIIQSCF